VDVFVFNTSKAVSHSYLQTNLDLITVDNGCQTHGQIPKLMVKSYHSPWNPHQKKYKLNHN
jgi:hypothetical protein